MSRSAHPRVILPIALATALALALGACASEAADPCADESVTLTATVIADAMDPSALEVCRDQEVTLEIEAETDGEFHLHGYDEQVPEVELTNGETTTVTFTADVPGQFIIELHVHDAEEIEIGVLTVNEP